MNNLSYIEAKYLKHAGKLIDVKVTIKVVDDMRVIYIRDLEIYSFKKAAKYLRDITENEINCGGVL